MTLECMTYKDCSYFQDDGAVRGMEYVGSRGEHRTSHLPVLVHYYYW